MESAHVNRTAKVVVLAIAGILVMGLFVLGIFSKSAELKVGDRAPDFVLPDQNGRIVKLADFLGRKSVILAFYPRASTPG